jgi:hypothetical protein
MVKMASSVQHGRDETQRSWRQTEQKRDAARGEYTTRQLIERICDLLSRH